MHVILLFLLLVSAWSAPFAQASDFERRLELAEKMHEYRPVRNQVDRAIDVLAQRLPASERDKFIASMKSILNYNSIETISIDAMAETFTVAELEAMTDYYSKPEATSATKKLDDYSKMIQPEIAKIIDKAIMRMRTGQ